MLAYLKRRINMKMLHIQKRNFFHNSWVHMKTGRHTANRQWNPEPFDESRYQEYSHFVPWRARRPLCRHFMFHIWDGSTSGLWQNSSIAYSILYTTSCTLTFDPPSSVQLRSIKLGWAFDEMLRPNILLFFVNMIFGNIYFIHVYPCEINMKKKINFYL